MQRYTLVNPENGIKPTNSSVKVFTPQIPFVRPFLLVHGHRYEPYLSLVTLAILLPLAISIQLTSSESIDRDIVHVRFLFLFSFADLDFCSSFLVDISRSSQILDDL